MDNILNIIDFLNEKIRNLNKFVKEYDEYKVKVNKELQNNIQELIFI